MITPLRKNSNPENMLRISIAAVYIWFGALKFFPQLSPADQIAKQTIHCLTFGILPDMAAIIMLAILECALGLLLAFKKWMRFTIYGILTHLILTFSPFLLFPADTFQSAPYGFTLLGQYIFKNIILISAACNLLHSNSGQTQQSSPPPADSLPESVSFQKENSKKVIFH